MRDQQPELLAFPPRNAYPQQSEQVLEELPVQLYFLTLWSLAEGGSRTPRCLSQGSGFLFGDGGADAVEEGKEEGQVNGARDLGTVFEVEGSEFCNYGLDCAVWREELELRLACHCCECELANCSWSMGKSGEVAYAVQGGARSFIELCVIVEAFAVFLY